MMIPLCALIATGMTGPMMEDEAVRKACAHLRLYDFDATLDIVQEQLCHYPHSRELHIALMTALGARGDDGALIKAWEAIPSELHKDRNVLEAFAWGMLHKAERSSQVEVRLASLIGAASSRDVRAVPLVLSALRSSSGLARLVGVRLAAQMGDYLLREELKLLFSREKMGFVRHEVIRAIGQLHLVELKTEMLELMMHPYTSPEEKSQALMTLVEMYDTVDAREIRKLLKSPRAGLRQLACELAGYYDLPEVAGDIKRLLRDASPDVRMQAMHTLVVLDELVEEDTIRLLVQDISPEVAIVAAWLACRQGHTWGVTSLTQWLMSPRGHDRWRAAAFLSKCGPIARTFLLEQMDNHDDPLVRANLAWGALGARFEVKKASQCIAACLDATMTMSIMWDRTMLFPCLMPSDLVHVEGIHNYPRIIDQITRLELLNVLCIVGYPNVQQTVETFMVQGGWGVAGSAMVILLQEGSDEMVARVRGMLTHPDLNLRTQAALLITAYEGDPAASRLLRELYPLVNRETKMQILEALGQGGSLETIPFLIEVVKEPFQQLRVVAAGTILQCLSQSR